MTHLRPRLLSALLPLALAMPGASCADPLVPPDAGAVLFEVESVNFAWGRSWYGFVVDAQGGVYAYDLTDTNLSPPEDGAFTAEELEAKYGHHRRLVKTLGADEAISKYERVAAAAAGSITAPKGACADAGTIRYTALIYDASTGRYRRLLLHQRGDVGQTNLSLAAHELYRWLADVTATAIDSNVCDPYG
jgi:hypothetical protein